MNKILKSVLVVGSLSLLGAACVKGTDSNVNVAQNANVGVNTNSIDTADWLTYTDSTYGFSFRYPSKYSINTVSSEEFSLVDNGTQEVKFYIQPYATAPDQDGLLYSKDSLIKLKSAILTSRESVSINNLTMKIGYGYDVPGAGFMKEADFFQGNNFIKVSIGINPKGIQYPTHQFNDETRSWADSIIEQLKKGELLSSEEEDQITLFDSIIKSIISN